MTETATSSLEVFWTRLRLEFLKLSEGGTIAPDPNRVHGGATKSKPPPPAGSDLRGLERDWEKATTDKDRREVLRDAIEVLRCYVLPNPDPSLKKGTQEWRQAIAGSPHKPRTVARIYGVSVRTVYNFREEFRA